MENTTVIERLQAEFPGAITETKEFRGQLSIRVAREQIVEIARFLRDDADMSFNFLENLCGVDYLGRTPRFEVVYHLLSHQNRRRVCLKVGLPEANPSVPSLTELWPTANWQEREAYDLFGITFDGHPSLYRIVMPDDWIGHPLRKDVPLGYEEVAFTINEDRINARKPYAEE